MEAGEERVQRRVVAVLGAAQVAGGVGIGAAVSVGALLALDLTGSAAWAGIASTGTTLGAALAVVAASARSFPLYLVALAFLGVGSAANLQARFAATDLAPQATRARSLGLVVWATTVGAVAGPNLTRPGAALAGVVGVPPLAGPLLLCSAFALLAALVLLVALRPDPLLTARAAGPARLQPPDDERPSAPAPERSALAVVAAAPAAVVALASLVTGHGVMVAVMSLTPVHMDGEGAGLELIGLTISLHIAGMYALSPLVGWFADRRGRTPAIATGQALLLAATLLTATAGASTGRVMAGLVLLGLGWSFSTVASSALLADAVPAAERPRVQGTADLLMNLAGAVAALAAGAVVYLAGYAVLSLAAAAAVLPAAAVVGRRLVAARRSAGREPLLLP